jgi:hypothetical protein
LIITEIVLFVRGPNRPERFVRHSYFIPDPVECSSPPKPQATVFCAAKWGVPPSKTWISQPEIQQTARGDARWSKDTLVNVESPTPDTSTSLAINSTVRIIMLQHPFSDTCRYRQAHSLSDQSNVQKSLFSDRPAYASRRAASETGNPRII